MVLITPAPRPSGFATTRRPTWPSVTRTNSSKPSRDAIFRETTARTRSGASAAQPRNLATNGRRTCWQTTMLDTGYPGNPRTGTPSITAQMAGLPGMISIPCTRISPSRPRALTVKS